MHSFDDVNVSKGAVAIHWFGQSSFAVKDPAGTVVWVDPYFPHDRPEEKFVHAEPPVDEAALRADYVLLTHDHSDHTCLESLERIHKAWPKARFIGPTESVARLVAAGMPREATTQVHAGGDVSLGTMTAYAVYAKPPGGDPEQDIPPPDVTHLGYVLAADEVRVYISGDPINNFAEHAALVSAVAALNPDIGLLTAHPTEGEFPFFEGSVKMARRIGLKAAVPAHYACFVKRNYDPREWAAQFPAGVPQTIIIPYDGYVQYPKR